MKRKGGGEGRKGGQDGTEIEILKKLCAFFIATLGGQQGKGSQGSFHIGGNNECLETRRSGVGVVPRLRYGDYWVLVDPGLRRQRLLELNMTTKLGMTTNYLRE